MSGGGHRPGGHKPAGAAAGGASKPPSWASSTSTSAAAHPKSQPANPAPGKLLVKGSVQGPSAAVAAAAPASAKGNPIPPPPQQLPPPPQSPHQPRMVDCAVSLQFLIEFCATVPEDMPTWKVVTDVIVPATKSRRCRYVEVIEPRHVGHCDFFISHRWATPFSHLVRYVRKHLVELGDVVEEPIDSGGGANGGGGGTTAATASATAASIVLTKPKTVGKAKTVENDEPKRNADKVFVWCDIFAINQHPGQVQADDLAQLKDCVEASHQTLLCLDDKGLVLTRIWCLYEIWNTVLAGGPPKLAVLGYDVNQDAFKEVYITLDVAEAQATVDSDRVRILADIAASTGLQELNLVIKNALIESTEAEAENALKVMLPLATEWKAFSRVMECLNKHTQMLSSVGRHQEAARYGNIIQTVSSDWQKAQAALTEKAATARSTSGSGAGPAAAAAAAAAEVPEWHWSRYPRDTALRQAVEKAASAEHHGRFDSAMSLYREAVAAADKRRRSAPAAASRDADLDLAGCRLHLGAFLAARGYLDQATSDAGEPAAKAFERHCCGVGGPSRPRNALLYASVAHQVAMLAKNNWERKDLRGRLLDAAYLARERHLGPTHSATLETLREKAEFAYMNGDFDAGVQLFHKLAVRMSEGTDLAAKPPPSAAAAAAAETTAAYQALSTKACEVWFLLATYLSNMVGREDDVIRICRALIPHKRRDHIRRLRDVASDPSSEWYQDATDELRRLGLSRAVGGSRPSSTVSSAASAAARRASGGGSGGAAAFMELEPDGLTDPDDPRVDVIGQSAELTQWSTMLAKKGQLADAVLMQWRLAEACRGNRHMATMETQLPAGKVTMVEAYERCLMLDLQVPGIAKLAAKMLAERDGTAAQACADGSSSDGAGAAAATVAVAQLAYDGPSYMELVQDMTAKWSAMDLAGAEPVCRQIVACQAAAHGAVSKEVVDAKDQLARLLQHAGRREEAEAEMREALAVHEQILHGKDPTMARTLQSLAEMVEDRAQGEALHRRAVDLLKRVYGPDHTEVGQAMMQLGGFIMNDYERLDEGQQIMQHGLDVHQKFLAKQAAKAKAF